MRRSGSVGGEEEQEQAGAARLSTAYGDGLNRGYSNERFSYSCGQSPSYTNYRMGWSTGYADCQANPRYHGNINITVQIGVHPEWPNWCRLNIISNHFNILGVLY